MSCWHAHKIRISKFVQRSSQLQPDEYTYHSIIILSTFPHLLPFSGLRFSFLSFIKFVIVLWIFFVFLSLCDVDCSSTWQSILFCYGSIFLLLCRNVIRKRNNLPHYSVRFEWNRPFLKIVQTKNNSIDWTQCKDTHAHTPYYSLWECFLQVSLRLLLLL